MEERAPSFSKNQERGNSTMLESFSLADLHNYKKTIEDSIKTTRDIMAGINKEKDGTAYDYYERHLISETEELAETNREIAKRKI